MTTKLPGIPPVPADASPSLKAYLQAVGEALEVRLGRRGDPIDRAITLRELIDSGLAVKLKAASYDPNNITAGNIGFVSNDGGVSANTTMPPVPTGLSVSAGFATVLLEWNSGNTLFSNFAFTEIFRSTTNVIGDAVLIGISSTFTFSDDTVQGGTTYYYWIRHVSLADIRGPFNATAGIAATVATDVSFLLTQLTGAISASQLTQSLAEQIDGSGSAADISALETFVGFDSTYTGDPLKTLIELNEGRVDSLDTYTGYTSSYTGSSLLTRLTGAEADIVTLENTVDHPTTGLSATVTALTALTARVTTNENDIDSNATSITSLQTDLTAAEGDITTNASAISSLDTRVTTAEGTITSHTSDITTLQSDLTAAEGDITTNASAITALGTRVTATETDITSQASDISALESTVDDPTTGVSATASALSTLTTTVTQQGSDLTALTSDVSTLSSTVGTNTTSIQTQQTTINGLSGQYTVKIDSNGYVAGFGLANTSSAAGASSEFTVAADRFSLIAPNGDTNTITTPFVVVTTGGGTGVYMDGAYIKDASITTAKINNLTVDFANVTGDLSADRISGGTIDTSLISVDGSTITRDASTGALKINAVNANLINTGTLNGNNVNVTNLNAGNIVSGILTSDRIDVTDLLLPTGGGTVSGATIGAWTGSQIKYVMQIGVGLGYYQGFVRLVGGTNHVKTVRLWFTTSSTTVPSPSNTSTAIYISPYTAALPGHVDRFYSNVDSANIPISFVNGATQGGVYLWVDANADSPPDSLDSVQAHFIRLGTGSSTFVYGPWSSYQYQLASPATFWATGGSNGIYWNGVFITAISGGGSPATDNLILATDGYQYERGPFVVFSPSSFTNYYQVRRRTYSN